MTGIIDLLGGAVGDTETFLAWSNRAGFDAVNSFATRSGWLHPVMTGYATYGVVVFAALLLTAWWLARRSTSADPSTSSTGGGPARKMAAALWAPAGMLVALGLNQIVVASVHELRPYTVVPGALVLVARSTDYAFPSDHAVMAGAVAAGVWLVSRRLGCLAAAAALLMAFARVYVGAHWPGDVLVGLVFGAAVTVVGYLLGRELLASAVTGLTRTRLRPLVAAHAAGLENPEPPASDPAECDPAPSAADTWARGPRDTLW